MENLDIRHMASDDPRGFFKDHGDKLILDEIQRVPDLFSYLQEKADSAEVPASYILTGSQQFLLMENITQSLAGRIITFQLYPFTFNELHELKRDKDTDFIFKTKTKHAASVKEIDIYWTIFTGMYPRIHDKKLDPRKWIENYILTYIERDIRSLINVENLKLFEDFLKLCASFSGQLVNYASISNAIGVSQPTVKKWLSLLETSGVIFLLSPHHANFKKRIVKTQKLFFMDTGILCYLLSIRTAAELKNHPLFGSIFETFIINELYKRIYHLGEKPPLYFWRDKTGNEVDLILDKGQNLIPVEIKSSMTYDRSLKSGLSKWLGLKNNMAKKGFVLYRGEEIVGRNAEITIAPWWTF
jgi:predicted AAA+ superfamily ATPase